MKSVVSVVLLLISTTSLTFGVGKFGMNFDYSYGIPVTGLDNPEIETYYETFYFNQISEIPMKNSFDNYSIFFVVNPKDYFGLELGYEQNASYTNYIVQLLGYYKDKETLEEGVGYYNIREGVIDYAERKAIFGGRYNILTKGRFQPVVRAGISISHSVIHFDSYYYSDKCTLLGIYGGASLNLYLHERFAITLPLKATYFGKSQYKAVEPDGNVQEWIYKNYYKVPTLFTVGLGLEFYFVK